MSRAPDAGERVKLWRTKEERETLENHAGAHHPTHPHAFAWTPCGVQALAQSAHVRRRPALSAQRHSRIGCKLLDVMQEHLI